MQLGFLAVDLLVGLRDLTNASSVQPGIRAANLRAEEVSLFQFEHGLNRVPSPPALDTLYVCLTASPACYHDSINDLIRLGCPIGLIASEATSKNIRLQIHIEPPPHRQPGSVSPEQGGTGSNQVLLRLDRSSKGKVHLTKER